MFPRKINSLTLKFKASLNKFNLSTYFNSCANLSNTIIICETNANKIIGGFTPLNFKSGGYRN